MGFKCVSTIIILLGVASGCAAWRSPQPEDGVVGPFRPPAFEQILIARDSVALSDVVSILVSKGYAVIWDSPREIAARYQILPGQTLVMSCAYLGQSKMPAGALAAAVSCAAEDLATGEKVYLGHGESQVRAGQGYVSEAIQRALEKFPGRDGTGYVLSFMGLPLRPAAPAGDRPAPAVPGSEGSRPHG